MRLDFTQPVNMGNPTVDPTAGRGYLDDDEPTFATRVALRLAQNIQRDLTFVDRYVADNWGFNRTPIKPDERIEMVQSLRLEDLDSMAGVYGRDRVAELVVETKRMLEQGAIPEEPPLGL